jgi:hypothetical protein
MGIFGRMLMELAQVGQDSDTLRIDASHLKAHRTASSLHDQRGALVTSMTA